MKEISLLLIIIFALHSCKNENQRKNEVKSPALKKEQQNKITLKNSPQNTEEKKIPTDYIPEGYVEYTQESGVFAGGWNKIKGDLNKDGREDIVLIIKATDKTKIIKEENRGELDRNRRGIIVLINQGKYYEVAAKNYTCFSSENEDGGVYFAPELDVEINKGNLHISYGHGRYGSWIYTFRYQNGMMELIGYDAYVSRGPVPQYELSINFLTKKKLTSDNLYKDDDADHEPKFVHTWEKIKVKKMVKLSDIEDFDDLYFDQ